MDKYLLLSNRLSVIADEKMQNETVKKLWHSFTFTTGALYFEKSDSCTFRFGAAPLPTLSEGKEYALTVSEQGVAIVGRDYGGLMRGFMSLLMKIEQDGTVLKIKTLSEESDYKIANRMLHICVFPENDLYYIKKLIRLAAVCQYTHIVIEFWGMLQYDCLKELAWPHAFTKEQAKELITECRELGMEPIPMFNQLGHASGSRGVYGKHVVLDQAPQLQHLFTPDGWVWDITSEKVFALLKQVREELYELFGNGEYIHIGCDEADYISDNDGLYRQLPDYLKKLTEEVEKEGRQPMVWMDMLLEAGMFADCYAAGKKDTVPAIRQALAKSTVFVDWQYNCLTAPIPTLVSLKDSGHKVIGAPWHKEENYTAHVQTVVDHDLFGIMMTTWHTLKKRMFTILSCAKVCGARSFWWSDYSIPLYEVATLLRRVSFEGNSYADSGWSKEQIDV